LNPLTQPTNRTTLRVGYTHQRHGRAKLSTLLVTTAALSVHGWLQLMPRRSVTLLERCGDGDEGSAQRSTQSCQWRTAPGRTDG